MADQVSAMVLDGRRRTVGRFLAVSFIVTLGGREAQAQFPIVKRPGDHPSYVFEAQPELVLVFGKAIKDGPGLGFRGSIPIMHNGFIGGLNNQPAISFGVSHSPAFKKAAFYAPLVLQWNFYVLTRWSVFGEAGGFVVFGDPERDAHLEFASMVGARYHLSADMAITGRVSVPQMPAASIGMSFFF